MCFKTNDLFLQLIGEFFERLFGQFARSDICRRFILEIAQAVFQKLEFGASVFQLSFGLDHRTISMTPLGTRSRSEA